MSDRPPEITDLEQRRSQLYDDLRDVGDFRRGNVHAVRRKCGKPNCVCAQPDHPGHGPQYNLTRSVAGKTVNRHLKPGPELDKIEREVANYEHFRDLVAQVTEVNDAICDARPLPGAASGMAPVEGAEKRGSSPKSTNSSPPS